MTTRGCPRTCRSCWPPSRWPVRWRSCPSTATPRTCTPTSLPTRATGATPAACRSSAPNEHRGPGATGSCSPTTTKPSTLPLFDHHPSTNHADGDTAVAVAHVVDDRVFCPPLRRGVRHTAARGAHHRAAAALHRHGVRRDRLSRMGPRRTDGGNLTVVHLDREVSAVPATDVCWQC